MAIDQDPYRTLGLSRGASIEEIKRAYRRLAKIHHPDAAGEKNVPRFLAIQAAYEQLAGGLEGRGASRRPASAPRKPWDADPDRSDATRRAYGGRARGPASGGSKPPSGTASNGSGAPGPEAGPGPKSGAGAKAGSQPPPGATRPGRRGAGTGGSATDRAGGYRGLGRGQHGPGRADQHRPLRHATTRSAQAQQGDPRFDVLRRRRRSVRARLARRELVRHDERHVLDAEPQGIRRPAQARPRIPGASPAGDPDPDARRARTPPTRRTGPAPLTVRPRWVRRRRPRRDPRPPDPHDQLVVGIHGRRDRSGTGSRRRRGGVRGSLRTAGQSTHAGPAAARSRTRHGRYRPSPDRSVVRRHARPRRSGPSWVGCRSPSASRGWSARSPAAGGSRRPVMAPSIRS